MASGWGNMFSSLGESADKRALLTRDDAIRKQEQADKDRQFKLMMDQFLSNQAQQVRGNKLEDAKIASSNLTPDAEGSAGSLNADNPLLQAVKGTPYDRSTPGQTLGTSPIPGGMGIGQTTAPQATGKFVWKPSWEQQQTIDARNEHVADIANAEKFQTSERQAGEGFQASQSKGQQTFQATQSTQQQSFQAAEQQKQIAASLAQVKLQIGNRLNPQQDIAMKTLDVMLAHQPKPGLDGTINPQDWDQWMKLAAGPMATLGIGQPSANTAVMPPAPTTPDKFLNTPQGPQEPGILDSIRQWLSAHPQNRVPGNPETRQY